MMLGDSCTMSITTIEKSMELPDLGQDLTRAIHEVVHLGTFVEIVLAGMTQAGSAVDWLLISREAANVLHRPDPFASEEEFERHRDDAKTLEDFAKDQANRGFPLLFSIVSIRLWSILEVMVDDFVRRLVLSPESLPPDSILHKIKGPLLPYVNASPEAKSEIMTAALKQELGAALKPGAARMEELLRVFGLAGSINEIVRRLLLESWAVRNVLVHRNGIVDKRFLEVCPWLRYSEGGSITLTRNQFRMYSLSAEWYIAEMCLRISRKFSVWTDQQERTIRLQENQLVVINNFLRNRPDAEPTT
jgi:hypothetical protein